MKLEPMTEQELEEKSLLYDAIYEMAQVFIKVYNPCQFGDDGKCLDSRKRSGANDFCCSNCEHVTDKGCSVKSISCKTSFCTVARAALPPSARRLVDFLQGEDWECFRRYSSFRMSKEQVFEHIRKRHTITDDLVITKEIVKYDDVVVVKKYDDMTNDVISSEVIRL